MSEKQQLIEVHQSIVDCYTRVLRQTKLSLHKETNTKAESSNLVKEHNWLIEMIEQHQKIIRNCL